MLIAQLTDMHIKASGVLTFGKLDTALMLQCCVQHLNVLQPKPDVALVTGDLTNDGRPEEYQALRALLDCLDMPYFLIPGNHDNSTHLLAEFGGSASLPVDEAPIQYVVDMGRLRFVGLDTTVPGQPGGRLGGERLAWIDARLAEAPDRQTILFMHHPPFLTGIGHMDEMGLADRLELEGIVRRYPQIERVLCGHLHRPIHVHWANTVASTAPSTAHQVALALEKGAAARWRAEPPAVALHWWHPRQGIVSHLSYVQDFGPEQIFTDEHDDRP